MYPKKKLTCQKISVFEIEYTFFNQRNKNIRKKTINFCHFTLQNQIIRVKTSKPQIQCLKWICFFFSQRNEIYVEVEEDHLFLPPFKNVSQQNLHAKKFQCLKLITLFSIKGTKSMWKKTISFCHLSKNKLSR